MSGKIIGYDINERSCQISYYSEEAHEPCTLEVAVDNFQIPLVLGYHDQTWFYGKRARRLSVVQEGYTVDDLFRKACDGESVECGTETYEAIWLLQKFIELSLESFGSIGSITFTLPAINEELTEMMKEIAGRTGIDRKAVYVQDYKESFCYYMFFQPKELWQYESALFYCDCKEIKAFMLRKLRTTFDRENEPFVTIDEVAGARMEELKAIFPVLNVDKAKEADLRFKRFIQGVFEKRRVSSVYLTGEGFDGSWYPGSLRVLCNGRKGFQGNNLFSKGACYTAYRRNAPDMDGPVYLDDTKMMEQISFFIRKDGTDVWYPVIRFGSHWYESDREWEVLLTDGEDIEIKIESLATGETKIEKISLEGLAVKKPYTVRLALRLNFQDDRTVKATVEDIGFGEFMPASDFKAERLIRLGGSNGQFNSLS